MSRQAGPVCRRLREAIAAGARGTYRALADAAGVPADQARTTLKEMSRRGEFRAAPRRARREPAVYEQHFSAIDPLAFAQAVWR